MKTQSSERVESGHLVSSAYILLIFLLYPKSPFVMFPLHSPSSYIGISMFSCAVWPAVEVLSRDKVKLLVGSRVRPSLLIIYPAKLTTC